jgi:GeoRSP system SPASM domain protein
MELRSPVRIYWDIGPESLQDVQKYFDVCEELRESKILSVNLTDSSPGSPGASLRILERLSSESISISLTLLQSAASTLDIRNIIPLKARSLLIRTSSIEDLPSIVEMRDAVGTALPLGVSFEVTRTNCMHLPRLLSFCAQHRIASVVLPMQRLTGEQTCFYLSRKERNALSAELSTFEKPEWMKLIVHDPFLWRVIFPSSSFPDGRCQAANTMLYISPAFEIYPCPSLPIKIGSLANSSLRDIISSPEKQSVRSNILAIPDGCRQCADLSTCNGGCRGRAFFLKRSQTEPDPGCA